MKPSDATEDQIKAIMQAMDRTASNVDAVKKELGYSRSFIKGVWQKNQYRRIK